MSLCLSIVLDAIERIFEPISVEKNSLLLIVGPIGLFINVVGLLIFGHGHSHNVLPEDAKMLEDEIEKDEFNELNNAEIKRELNDINENDATIIDTGLTSATQQSNENNLKKLGNSTKLRNSIKCCSILCNRINLKRVLT